VLCAAAWLGGCGTWFGESDDPPLPGERVSVLAHQGTVNPDADADPASIMLPRPQANADWPQPGGYANHAMHHLEVAARPERAWLTDIGRGATSSQPRLASPIIAGGRVYAMDSDHVVGAYDASSGERIWRVDLADDEEDDDTITGGIAFEEGRIFATTGFAKVIALDAASGDELWRVKKGAPFHSPPTVRGGRVFAIGIDNTLYALSAHDGGELWKHQAIVEVANLLGGASPAVDAGVVVAPFSSGELVALKVETGRVLWSDSLTSARRTDELGSLSQIRAAPVIRSQLSKARCRRDQW
jgi:outer membrane protein assembly factor BamB